MKFSIVSFVVLMMGISLFPSEDSQTNNSSTNGLNQNNLDRLDRLEMTDNFTIEWKEIDSLISKQLPKSALEKVVLLQRKLANTDHTAQIIKCIIYQNRLLIELQDYDPSLALVRLQENINKERNPVAKSVMTSMLAELYFLYAQRNQYTIKDRTYTKENPADLATWSLASLIKQSNQLYLESIDKLHDEAGVLAEYESILVPNKDDLNFTPDINSFLLHRVVKHFSNSQSMLTEPVYAFVMDDKNLLGDADTFIALEITSEDSTSYKYQALKAYQSLLSYLTDKGRQEELLYTDLNRISFVRSHLKSDGKDQLYFERLESYLERYGALPISSEISHQVARYLKEKGARYQQGFDKQYKGYNKKALEIAEAAAAKFPKSLGAQNCNQLIENIKRKELRVQLEHVVGSNQPYLVYTSFRNIESVYFKLYPVTNGELYNLRRLSQKKKIEHLSKLKSVQGVHKTLLPIDYDYHAVEHILQGLDFGQYMLVASDEEDISSAELVSFGSFRVSDLAYAAQDVKDKLEVLVFDRNTGQPINNAAVELHEESWREKQELSHLYTKHTNSDGKCVFKKSKEVVSLIIKHKDDVFDTDDRHYGYQDYEGGGYENCHVFTDRNIYRPGQKLYFKGLYIKYDKDQLPKIRSSKKVKVILRDPNYQIVKEASFRTNEFGTFHGNFDLPSSGLNGSFLVEVSTGGDQIGSTSIRVEEYKRPKFEVSIDTLDINYKIGDTVAVTGLAQTFAGSPIDEVQVRYRVTRSERFSYWSWWRPYSSTPEQEIINGETTTRKDGSFEIEVPLITGSTSKSSTIYNYKVSVDVIDISGETRSAESTIQVSNTSVFASLEIGKQIDLADINEVTIKTENVNGKHVDANGVVVINKLVSEDKYYVNRYWSATDTTLIGRAEWENQVPNYRFGKKKNLDQVEVESQVLKEGFNTGVKKTMNLSGKLEVGLYKITTHVGDESATQYLYVNDFKAGSFAGEELLSIKDLKPSYQPGDEVALTLGSMDNKLYVYAEVESNGKIITSKWMKLDGVQTLKFKIREKDRGGVFIKLHYALNNRVFDKLIKVNVPWTNKDLKIEYTTIRNKIAPGSEEQWQIKISGGQKDKVSAELLATMYDASLDQLAGKHRWNLNPYPNRYAQYQWRSYGFGSKHLNQIIHSRNRYYSPKIGSYPDLNWFGLKAALGMYERHLRKEVMIRGYSANAPAEELEEGALMLDEVVVTGSGAVRERKALASKVMPPEISYSDSDSADDSLNQQAEEQKKFESISPRTNLNETVFFFPDMKTDEEGNITLNFTMNEALTKWNFMTMAHTQDLEYGYDVQEITTFKNLMVFPNPPRFIRQGDELKFSAKVQNMTDETLSVDTKIELIDAVTEESLIASFGVQSDQSQVSIAPLSSELLVWNINVPNDFSGLVKYRVLASDGTYSDGEESYLPALSNRMMVTETMPMNVKGNQTKTFTFDSFSEKSKSSTLDHANFTIEYTSNPAWYAIQAMPYLMEYPHECSEQLFNRYYANALSSQVANSSPRIKQVFDSWKTIDKEALLSNLSKNQELKSAILEETPWVMQAKSEEEQKQNLGLLFDLNKMSYEQDKALGKLAERQSTSGGFSWFPGGRDSRYVTQYIVEGLGHLDKLGVRSASNNSTQISQRAISYIDKVAANDYRKLMQRIEDNQSNKDDKHLYALDLHYLYTKSFFPNQKSNGSEEAIQYFMNQAEKYWTDFNHYEQAMIALVMHRANKKTVATDILKSIKERSILHDELGRYWKLGKGYRWNQHPIETQALMIELFAEMGEEQVLIDELRIWLLKNKQTNSWKTTKATAAAIYALMINKDKSSNTWLADNQQVSISYGSSKKAIDFDKAEAGTLYTKKSFEKSEIDENLSSITVSNPNEVISWGSAYWQYFEDLDKITTFEDTPLQLKKQLFIETIKAEGPQLDAVSATNLIKQGDKVKVRVELRVDRSMEFVHMKDMRASGFEPISVLSQYKWQDGLGYYESTKDVATHFFFSNLPKGTYVFEYDLRATHKGTFSNGITTIQSMYAPEFTSHSEGVEVVIN